MSESPAYVDESPIHGKGLFARRLIMEGEVIGVVDGEETVTDGIYVLWVNDERALEVKCDLRFINHSDNPNAAYYDTLEVCALRDISPGEEITHDYMSGSEETELCWDLEGDSHMPVDGGAEGLPDTCRQEPGG